MVLRPTSFFVAADDPRITVGLMRRQVPAEDTGLEFLAIALLGLAAGLLIGCIGIGGVILVPALAYLGHIPIPVAIAAAMMGYLFAGIIGTLVYAKERSIRWSMAGALFLGAMPAALLGAWTANRVDPAYLETGIGVLTIASGIYALLGSKHPSENPDGAAVPSAMVLAVIGAVTGFGSAISGTGGPLVLIPILMWLQLPVLTAIGLAQVIQIPIATFATAGNFLYGAPDIALGAMLAVGLAAGSYLGARIAHAVPRVVLRRVVALVLIAVGTVIVWKVSLRLFA